MAPNWKRPGFTLRPWMAGDAESLSRHLDDRRVWLNLRDRVPHPYRVTDAEEFLGRHVGVEPPASFAIEIAGEAVGGATLHRGEDVYFRGVELGFWLGHEHWGRGIMSQVVPILVDYAFATFTDVCRIHAEVMAWNPASARILQKAGFVKEGTLRAAVTKAGQTIDKSWFALVREDRV